MSPVVRSVSNKHESFIGTRTGSVARNPNFLEDTSIHKSIEYATCSNKTSMRAEEVSAIKFDPDPTTNRKKEREREDRDKMGSGFMGICENEKNCTSLQIP
jgi:hypothetical protein